MAMPGEAAAPRLMISPMMGIVELSVRARFCGEVAIAASAGRSGLPPPPFPL